MGDELFTLSFDKEAAGLDALQRAAYALAGIMTVDIRTQADKFLCDIFPAGDLVDKYELAQRYRREFIDQTLRIRIGRQTAGIRDLVFAVAFSQTALVTDPSGSE